RAARLRAARQTVAEVGASEIERTRGIGRDLVPGEKVRLKILDHPFRVSGPRRGPARNRAEQHDQEENPDERAEHASGLLHFLPFRRGSPEIAAARLYEIVGAGGARERYPEVD